MVDIKKIETIINTVIGNKTKIEGKCRPDYITSLPYDLRTTNINELNERLITIDENVDRLQKENEELVEWNKTLEQNMKDSLDECLNDINNLKIVFDADVLDDADKNSETYTDYENVKEAYNNLVTLYGTVSSQLNDYMENGTPVDKGLMEEYENACANFSTVLSEVYNLEDILDISANPLNFNERMYVYDGEDLDVEGTDMRGYYNNHTLNSDNIENNQKMIDDFVEEGSRTQDKIDIVNNQ